MFTGENAQKFIGAPSKALRRPNIPKYRVFIQSKGIGRRPLLKGTSILYEVYTGLALHELVSLPCKFHRQVHLLWILYQLMLRA